MKRICPFCKSNLHDNSVYFCISCGNVLPDSLQLRNLSFKKINKIVVSKKKRTGKFSKGVILKMLKGFPVSYIPLIFLFIILVLVGFYFLIKQSNSSISKMTESIRGSTLQGKVSTPVSSGSTPAEIEQKPKIVIEMELPFESGIFDFNNVYDYVPYEADFFAEFSDSSTLGSYFGFMGGEFFTLIENIKDKISQSYSVFFIDKNGTRDWGVIVFPIEGSSDIGTFDGIEVLKVDKALVISKQLNLVNSVSDSKSGISKSMSLNPVFINMKSSIPKEGKVLLISLTDEGNSVLSDIIRDTSSSELKSIIEAFSASKSNYLIIK